MRSLLIILSHESREPWAHALAEQAASANPLILTTSPAEASRYLQENRISPSHVVLDIGTRGQDVLADLDQLAQQCEPGTRVIAIGDTNDIHLYRDLIARGVIDYIPMPASPADVLRPLVAASAAPAAAPAATTGTGEKRVMVFMSAASGDGASTAALNTAYALSQLCNGNTVLVDMDYQFGMVAKHLALENQYGIRDLFDFPERGIDATLIKRMVASYGKLHVITAPAELCYLPPVSADAIIDLIATLKLNYDNVIIDLPHVWLPWVAAATTQATHLVLIAQLWLKSVSHAARLVRSFRELKIPLERIVPVINRSGAKFKEAIDGKDFERVCGIPIRYTLANDIKTIVTAEASANTIMEQQPSEISANIEHLARGLAGIPLETGTSMKRGGLFSRSKG
ncbi:MAG: hypothetical protein V4735_04230 [Pseudomonadota bacterium]